jgi:hypothetical protein
MQKSMNEEPPDETPLVDKGAPEVDTEAPKVAGAPGLDTPDIAAPGTKTL